MKSGIYSFKHIKTESRGNWWILLQMDTLTFEALYSAFQNVNHFKEC